MRVVTASVIAGWTLSVVTVVGVLVTDDGHPVKDPAFWIQLAVAAAPLSLAAVVAHRAPGHRSAVFLALSGLGFLIAMLPSDPPPAALDGAWVLLFLPLALMLLSYPDGRFGGRIRRGWAVAGVVVAAGFMTVAALSAESAAPSPMLSGLGFGLLAAFFVMLTGSAISVVLRYRTADARERLQLRWVYLSGFGLPLTLVLCWLSFLLLGSAELVVIGLALIFLALPFGASVGVLRPAWWDVDRAAVTSAVATTLSVLVLAALTVISVATGVALSSWAPALGTAAAAAVALLAVPGYRLARRAFGTLLYPERERAIRSLRALRADVAAGRAHPAEVEGVLRRALADPELVVGYRGLGDELLTRADGSPVPSGGLDAALTARGQQVGVIVPSAARVARVASAITREAAPFVDEARLQVELARARAEVTASRERLLRAGYEERRRLERDLHDGAQQRLVALGMRLRVLQRAASSDVRLATTLDEAVAELSTAVAELRRVAHGVRPSALDDGLDAALAHLSRTAPTPIDVHVHVHALPDAVSTTAYFVASEAVANALRHARAERIRVAVSHDGELLTVVVSDDGCGGAHLSGAGGLTGLHDRVAALGGRLEVLSPEGSGTVIRAELPCAS